MSPTASQTQDLAADIVGLLPDFARMTDPEAVAILMADTAACALGAEALMSSQTNAVSRAAQYAKSRGNGRATIWSTGEAASVEGAAFRNAVSVRYLDYNDTYVGRAIVHPSDMIPALVALAEDRSIAWPRLIESVGVAYEVLCRFAAQTVLSEKGWDASSLTPLGVAAGAAWMMGLDRRATENALKLATLDAATLRCIRQGRLSDWKAVASARGAVKGLFAVDMAALGTEAPPTAFENKDGFIARVSGPVTFGTADRPALTDVVMKRYPSQIFTQGMVEMAREIAASWGEMPAIDTIELQTSRRAVDMVGGHHAPGERLNRETADHSAPFCIAAMLTHGRLGYGEFGLFVSDPAVLALMAKVHVVADAACENSRFAAVLTVRLTDGRTLSARRDTAPEMDAAGLAQKLDDLWPADFPRDWPWSCPGPSPRFPVHSANSRVETRSQRQGLHP